LVTGTTGFLGKVLLEKLLYALPMVNRIYVLIRAKKGSKLNERFKREILDSPCFDRLRDKYGHGFAKFIESKVHPMYKDYWFSEGDLLKEGLGLSALDFKELSENCEIIMNCAASVDFNARLDDAININIKWEFRMMELARKCQRLVSFTHVSTCYVNCTLRGRVK
jgi:fatty acyl-CoA reductase